jgi:hypothetical protein
LVRGAAAEGAAEVARIYFGPLNSSNSHDLASLQSRMTLSGETFSTVAVSSTLKPPKNRSSMIRALHGSNSAGLLSASSSAMSSSPPLDETTGPRG